MTSVKTKKIFLPVLRQALKIPFGKPVRGKVKKEKRGRKDESDEK